MAGEDISQGGGAGWLSDDAGLNTDRTGRRFDVVVKELPWFFCRIYTTSVVNRRYKNALVWHFHLHIKKQKRKAVNSFPCVFKF